MVHQPASLSRSGCSPPRRHAAAYRPGVLAVAVLGADAEDDLGKVPLALTLVGERVGARWDGEAKCGRGVVEDRDVGREPAMHTSNGATTFHEVVDLVAEHEAAQCRDLRLAVQ